MSRSPTSRSRNARATIRPEHVKRYTTLGMGTDQGKTSNVNGAAILAPDGDRRRQHRHHHLPAAYASVTIGAMAGRDIGPLVQPRRKLPLNDWHAGHGAVFDHVGLWARPRYYRKDAEDMDAAVRRECLAVRNRVGLIDGSTFGKIDLQGPDCVAFPEPAVHERVGRTGRRPLQVRPDARRGRYGVRRRRHRAAGREPLFHDHQQRQRAGRRRLAGALVATRVARPHRVPDVGRDPMGDDYGLRTRRTPAGRDARGRHRPFARGFPISRGPRGHDRRRAGVRPSGQLHGRAFLRDLRAGELRDGALAGAVGRLARRWASRRSAPRRATCCAPRRDSSASATTPTAP